MQRQLNKIGKVLFLTFFCYSILSYLIFLRDDFLLERISYLLNKPDLHIYGRNLGKIFHVNSIPTLFYFLIIIIMFFLYAKALRILRDLKNNDQTRKVVIKFALIFTLISMLSFPALSTDVFDYISNNRVLFVHNANPWLHAPDEFPADDFIYLGSWKFRASVYGPVQFIFSSLVHLFAKQNIILNIIGFKVINAFFLIGLIFLIEKYLVKNGHKFTPYALAVFAWNPLIHIEIVGNAHNDVIMAFFTFLAFYWLKDNRILMGSFAISLAVLSKMASILFVPILFVWLLSRRNLKSALFFIFSFITTSLLGFASLGEGIIGLIKNLQIQSGLYLRSLPTILRFFFLKLGFQENKALIAEKALTLPAFTVFYLYFTRRISTSKLAKILITIMMAYLMIASPMLQPWYLLWFLPFISLLYPGRLQFVAIAFSFSSLLYYAFLFLSFYFSPLHFAWQITFFLIVVIPPVLIWIMPKPVILLLQKKVL